MCKYNMEEIFMEKKLFKRSLTFAMMIAVVFSTIIASSFIKANAAETEKAVTLIQGEKHLNTIQYSTGSCSRSVRRQHTGCNYIK